MNKCVEHKNWTLYFDKSRGPEAAAFFYKDPMEQDLTAFVKDAEHLDDRAANYVRLMDTREEVLQLDAKEDLED
ncbi:hypothetical protein DY000_02016234 [Brassica cretica]|uniref:Uncharacterized protein n=1 Tax=Brassica cretica TaxID=69181 RepID=A0ABQ7CXR5_BRACR|nr:hypothetical protein DY000_02016234 [Brassica cretica]